LLKVQFTLYWKEVEGFYDADKLTVDTTEDEFNELVAAALKAKGAKLQEEENHLEELKAKSIDELKEYVVVN